MPCGSTVPLTVAVVWPTPVAAPVVALGGPAATATAGTASTARTRAARRIALQDTARLSELRWALLAGRLAQQRAGRLLEDLAPGARALLLGREVLDDLAHARGGD